MSNHGRDLGNTEPRAGRVLAIVPAALYIAAIFYGGTTKGGPPIGNISFGDKLIHAAAFAGLCFVLWRSVSLLAPELPAARRIAWALGGAVATGGLLELVQSLLPYRSAEWLDLVADALGAAGAALALWLYAQRRDSSAGADTEP